jgi:hypothetical protein
VSWRLESVLLPLMQKYLLENKKCQGTTSVVPQIAQFETGL